MSDAEKTEILQPVQDHPIAKSTWKRALLLVMCLGGLYFFKGQVFGAANAVFHHFVHIANDSGGPPEEVDFEVSHECQYLDPQATQCWSHLKIVSLNDEPVTIKEVTVNGRKECTPDNGLQALAFLMASRFINVSNKTIRKGDAYGIGITCEPVDVEIVTDKGTWAGGKRR